MTIVLDRYPVLSAVVASAVVTMFVAGSIWLAADSLRERRSKTKWAGGRGPVVGVASTVLWVVFGAWWWHDWSPFAVELTGEAVELKYLLSTERIGLANVERVEFELIKLRRGRQRSIVRLWSQGRVYKLTQDPEPYGELATRPVRQVFDQLAARLPPHAVQDVTK